MSHGVSRSYYIGPAFWIVAALFFTGATIAEDEWPLQTVYLAGMLASSYLVFRYLRHIRSLD